MGRLLITNFLLTAAFATFAGDQKGFADLDPNLAKLTVLAVLGDPISSRSKLWLLI
jgi:hypothetical protein